MTWHIHMHGKDTPVSFWCACPQSKHVNFMHYYRSRFNNNYYCKTNSRFLSGDIWWKSFWIGITSWLILSFKDCKVLLGNFIYVVQICRFLRSNAWILTSVMHDSLCFFLMYNGISYCFSPVLGRNEALSQKYYFTTQIACFKAKMLLSQRVI